jgi:hypothetical protein
MVIPNEKVFSKFKLTLKNEQKLYKKINVKLGIAKYKEEYLIVYGEIIPIHQNITNRIKIILNLDPFFIIDAIIPKSKFNTFINNFPNELLILGKFKINFENQLRYFQKLESRRKEDIGYFCEQYELYFEFREDLNGYGDGFNFSYVIEDIVWETKNVKDLNDAIAKFFNINPNENFIHHMKWFLPKYLVKIDDIKIKENILSVKNKFTNPKLPSKIFINIICERDNQVFFRESMPINDNNKFILAKAPSKVIVTITSKDELIDKIEKELDISDEQIEMSHLNFIRNIKLRKILARDIIEANKSYSAGAWKSTIVMCGSILESILISELNKRKNKVKIIYNTLYKKILTNLNDLTLNQMIEIAIRLKFLNQDILSIAHPLRKFRNYIHPLRELDKDSIEPNESLAAISLNLVNMITKELSK